jgi:hypothetical protein
MNMPTNVCGVIAGALLATWMGGCQQAVPRTPGAVALASDSRERERADYLNVAEAVFRHQFRHNAASRQRRDFYFLSLEKRDPPAELLAKFAKNKPRVVPQSLAGRTPKSGVTHKELGGRGLEFYVSSVKWLDANTAEVYGGYYSGNMSASGNVYRVKRRHGRWVVTDNVMKWIS